MRATPSPPRTAGLKLGQPMPDSPVLFRLATESDIPGLVSLHFKVFDRTSHIATVLGRDFISQNYLWYIGSGSGFVVVAEDGAGLMGLCAFNSGPYYQVFKSNLAALTLAFALTPSALLTRAVLRRAGTFLRRLMRSRAQNSPADSKYACLALLAVHPNARRRRIAEQMVIKGVEMCRSRGWEVVVTAVHAGNSAIALYENVGFRLGIAQESDDLITLQLVLEATAGMPKNVDQSAEITTTNSPKRRSSPHETEHRSQ